MNSWRKLVGLKESPNLDLPKPTSFESLLDLSASLRNSQPKPEDKIGIPAQLADRLQSTLLQDFRDRPESRTFRDLSRLYAELQPILFGSKHSPGGIRRSIGLCREQLVQMPDLDIPYSWLSTLYEKEQQSEEALAVLHEGLLKCSRTSKLLTELGIHFLHHKSASLCLQAFCKAILAQEPPRKDAEPYLYLYYICCVLEMVDAPYNMLGVVDSLPNPARLDATLQLKIASLFEREVGCLQSVLSSHVTRMLAEGRIDS
jgi:hypothetical protein